MNLSTIRDMVGSTLAVGLVGMNFRNRQLIESGNPRQEIAVARDKILTKERLSAAGVTAPETIAVIRRAREIAPAIELLTRREGGFVVKPARSAQGRGILLCRSMDKDGLIKLSGTRLPREELIFHFYQILHGEFSFGRPDDAILIEELLTPDTDWILPDLPGPPDLRIVICRGEILMAMSRLPTSLSDGRANLHCGAVGVGIDLHTSKTVGGVLNDSPIDYHPDSGHPLAGQDVKDFDQCLNLALQCREAFALGYMGIDIMRDTRKGPVVLEVNARPGLGLQIANRKGLFQNTETNAI